MGYVATEARAGRGGGWVASMQPLLTHIWATRFSWDANGARGPQVAGVALSTPHLQEQRPRGRAPKR